MIESRIGRTAGFTLLEVLIATALLATVSAGVAHLFAVAATAGRAAREQTSATILAAAKMEQLRSLAWGYEPAVPGLPAILRSDYTANLSVEPATDDGPGLRPSPPGTLARSVPPYVDYLDALGRWCGNGSDSPPSAVFIRRWAVQPLAADPGRTIVLQVLVTTTAQDRSRPAGSWRTRSGQEALLVSVRTRKGL